MQISSSGVINSQTGEPGSSGITSQHAFLRASTAARVPGGLVWMMKCSGEEPLLHEDRIILPISDALESLVKRDPRYKWQIDTGVVNLLPSAGEPDLLKVRIRQFKTTATLTEALRQLLGLPEVTQGSIRLRLKQSTTTLLVGPTTIRGRPVPITVDVRDVTLRQALNALARANGRAIWEYRAYRCGRANQFSIDFLTQ
jgi:hypothetical protein